MKQIKKAFLGMLCVCTLFAVTACGNRETVNDKGTTNTTTDTNRKNTDDDGVLEDIGEGIDNGARDVVDGVEDVLDGNDRNNNTTNNNTTNNKTNNNTTNSGKNVPVEDKKSAE